MVAETGGSQEGTSNGTRRATVSNVADGEGLGDLDTTALGARMRCGTAYYGARGATNTECSELDMHGGEKATAWDRSDVKGLSTIIPQARGRRGDRMAHGELAWTDRRSVDKRTARHGEESVMAWGRPELKV